ncbi:LOW QUALITY PROTEIN: uncharacterized protein ACOB6Z_015589 [Ctenodactylus gundi]
MAVRGKAGRAQKESTLLMEACASLWDCKSDVQDEESTDEQNSSKEECHADGLERDIIPVIIASKCEARSERQWGRNRTCAPSVGRLSATAQTLPFIIEHTWTGPMTVSVGKPSGRAQTSLNIRRCIPKRRLTSVKIVGRPSVAKAASFDTTASTLGKSPISVRSVGRALVSTPASVPISASTLERSPTSVRSVGKPSTTAPTLTSIIGSILERSPIGVVTVGKPSVASQICPNIRESTPGRERCRCSTKETALQPVTSGRQPSWSRRGGERGVRTRLERQLHSVQQLTGSGTVKCCVTLIVLTINEF